MFHIEEIDRIRNIEEEVSLKTGKSVFDISHWNSGKDYHKYLYQYLELPVINDYFNYIYSYEISKSMHQSIREKLNFKSSNISSVFFSSSTLSIVNLINFMKQNKIKNICVLQPSYFSVIPCIKSFDINVYNEELEYTNGEFHIPIHKLLKKNYDAIWITSPVFCTNIGLNESEILKLNNILEKRIYLICDESLSTAQTQICSKLIQNEYLFSIYSPHKVLGINALKFSCIIMNQKHQDFFDSWSDLFSGGLSLSTYMAIIHFLTDNYEVVLQKSLEYVQQTYISLEKLLYNYRDCCSFTHKAGLYVTIMPYKIPYRLSTRHEFIKLLIENTGVSLLPGYLEGFYERMGFCFRINLTLDRTTLLLSLNKVLLYLEKEFL